MNTRSSYHGVSRRRFIATATAVTTFSISGLLHSGNLVAAAVADPKIDAMLAKAIEYLAQHQSPDGAFSPQSGVGVTALVTTGLLQNGRSPDDPLVARSLKFLEGFIQPDGGIYSPKLGYKNYETCIGLTCFVEANADKGYGEGHGRGAGGESQQQHQQQRWCLRKDLYHRGHRGTPGECALFLGQDIVSFRVDGDSRRAISASSVAASSCKFARSEA